MYTPATAPEMAEPIAVVEFEHGMREFDMMEALNAYCFAERSRQRMLAKLREALAPHSVLVLDCAGYRWGQRCPPARSSPP